MARITLKGTACETSGTLPAVGSKAPAFSLIRTDLSPVSAEDFRGRTLVLNLFPSIDTSVCAASVRRFNEEAGGMDNVTVLCISADLPFAHKRFCEGEGLKNVIPASTFRSPDFGRNYGVLITTGPFAGLLARAVMVIHPTGRVVYSQLVPEIAQEPDYDAVLDAVTRLLP